MKRMLRLSVVGSWLVVASTASCGGGSSGPPPETDDDFPLPLAAGLAPTPPMGWNSWNKFSCNITQAFVEQVADAMVTTGMRDAGYSFVNIDDCWSLPDRDPVTGALQSDPARFPDGIPAVATHVHGQMLKLGIYGDRGTETCGHKAGSEGHEMQDAQTFAGWGVDYLKYDNCAASMDPQTQYGLMRAALDSTHHDFVFSVCAWAFYEWAVQIGNLQRTTTDITNAWTDPDTSKGSILSNARANRGYAAYAGPNHWNDPDMLEVGNSDNNAGTVTDVENQSHFSLWAIMSAPLIAGNDPRNMSAATRDILTNPEIIAIDQDAMGLQGVVVHEEGDLSVWAKPVNANGARAVVLLNASAAAADVTVGFDQIGLGAGAAKVRDLQGHADLGTFTGSFTTNVPSHGTATLKIVGNEPPRPRGTAFLSDLRPIYAANGLGPIEHDTSNGGTDPGDGVPISIRGQPFAKGLGVAGPSAAIYRLGGQCTNFSATVGIDDSVGAGGSVEFQVWADGEMLFTSGVVTNSAPAVPVNVSLAGKRRLKLLVTDGGDGTALDRASWGDAQVTCAM